MTKFKKCDYCRLQDKTVSKYKTGTVREFGYNVKTTGEIIAERPSRVIFFLCKICKDTLITNESAIRNNIVDDQYWNEHLINYIFKRSNQTGKGNVSSRKGYQGI